MTIKPLNKGSVIGILGAGQLGRMLAQAASDYGYQTHIYAPDNQLDQTPAGQVAAQVTQAAYDDETALAEFAQSVDVISYEFENVPRDTAAFLSRLKPVRPGEKALEVAQDRLVEKTFIRQQGLGVADFADIKTRDDLTEAWQAFDQDAILKTRRFGYDGKGQWRVRSIADCEAAFNALNGQAAILEKCIPFDCEVSIIAARNLSSEIAVFDCVENVHENHILKYSYAPAQIDDQLHQQSLALAETMLTALDYIGVLAIELFVCGQDLLVNEIAPRVHNSGHWTMNACAASQFHQHILAITGHQLADPKRDYDAIMTNLLGDELAEAKNAPAKPSSYLHDYGKQTARTGRKMGHLNTLYPLGALPRKA